ncbi:hypothetical protein [Streptomyces sp. NPDC048295]|uniref:hypothetical protein n=1 Tax=Streptomyces sp. NPDC048295 TaxID=3154617 RepID=UPI00344A0EF6
MPALLGSVVLTALWAPMPWWWTFPHEDMTHTGHVLVGILHQPLVLWGPLVAAVAVSYYRRRRHAATGVARRPRTPLAPLAPRTPRTPHGR